MVASDGWMTGKLDFEWEEPDEAKTIAKRLMDFTGRAHFICDLGSDDERCAFHLDLSASFCWHTLTANYSD